MNKQQWVERITASTKKAGTYRPFFEDTIETLAAILEKRDEAHEQYVATGGKPVIKYTNKGGNTNPTKNPILIMWDDLNKSALAYWRDLGLTPAGLKKINEKAMEEKTKSSFAEVLKSLG